MIVPGPAVSRWLQVLYISKVAVVRLKIWIVTAPSHGTMQSYSQMRCSVILWTFALGSKRNRLQNHYAYFIQCKSSEHWFLFFAPTTVPLSSPKIGPNARTCEDFQCHPKTPRRFTLYHPWPLADSKQIEMLPPKMMCLTSHPLQSEGILNHLRRP